MTASAGWLEGLAERLGASATAATIFGAPIERGDTTVVPVARASYGFGGGGGGVRVSPVGFIEIRPGVVRYRPIRDWATLMPVLALGGIVTLLAARRLSSRRLQD